MSRTVQMTLQIDEDLKLSSAEFFKQCGLSLSQGIQLLLKKTLNDGQLLIRPRRYNETTLAAMRECDDIAAHPEKYRGYQTAEDMMAAIIAEEG